MSATKKSFLTVTLKHPFTAGDGKELVEVTLRRPKAKDIRRIMEAHPADQNMQGYLLAQILSGLVPEDFEELDGEDFVTISTKVGSLVGKGLAT